MSATADLMCGTVHLTSGGEILRVACTDAGAHEPHYYLLSIGVAQYVSRCHGVGAESHAEQAS